MILIRQNIRFMVLLCILGFASISHSQNWQSISGPYGGYVSSFGVFGNEILAGTAAGAVFSSKDTGKSWTRLGSPGTVKQFSCSRKSILAIIGSRAYRSIDSGRTWINFRLDSTEPGVTAIAANDSTLFASNGHGVFRSTDNGSTWFRVHKQWHQQTLYASDSFVYVIDAGEIQSGGIFRSKDDGQSWEQLDTLFSKQRVLNCFGTKRTLFVSTNKGDVYSSKDHAASWSKLSIPISPWVSSWAVSDSIVFLSTGSLKAFLSTDDGGSWKPQNDTLAQLFILGNIWIGSKEETVLRSTDMGKSWTESSTGINALDISDIAVHGSTILVATNRGVTRTTDNGISWNRAQDKLRYDETFSILQSKSTWYVMAAAQHVTDLCFLFRTTDYGLTWDTAGGVGFRFMSSDFGLVAANDQGLFVAWDGGVGYYADDPHLPRDVDTINWGPNSIGSLVASDSLVAWTIGFGADYTLKTSHDIGLTTTKVSAGDKWLAEAYGNSLFAVTQSAIFRSDDYGLSWALIKPSSNVRKIISRDRRLVVLEQDSGISVSADRGHNWQRWNANLPLSDINRISIDEDRLYVSLVSGGLYFASLPPASVGRSSTAEHISLTLSPNPAVDKVRIGYSRSSSQNVTITVLDVLGRAIRTLNVPSSILGFQEATMNTEDFPNGFYTVRMDVEGKSVFSKLQITH